MFQIWLFKNAKYNCDTRSSKLWSLYYWILWNFWSGRDETASSFNRDGNNWFTRHNIQKNDISFGWWKEYYHYYYSLVYWRLQKCGQWSALSALSVVKGYITQLVPSSLALMFGKSKFKVPSEYHHINHLLICWSFHLIKRKGNFFANKTGKQLAITSSPPLVKVIKNGVIFQLDMNLRIKYKLWNFLLLNLSCFSPLLLQNRSTAQSQQHIQQRQRFTVLWHARI